jgi:hypothetical protein
VFPVFGGQPLEQRVGMRREAHLERPEALVHAGAVEDDDPARSAHRDEARQPVDQRAPVAEAGGVEDVVPVEEVQGWLRH